MGKALLSRFRTIVVEFHGIGAQWFLVPRRQWFAALFLNGFPGNGQTSISIKQTAVMQKLLEIFHIVHTHECNFAGPYKRFGPYTLPDILEVTLVRHDLVEETSCHNSPYLTKLDLPDMLERPDDGARSTVLPEIVLLSSSTR